MAKNNEPSIFDERSEIHNENIPNPERTNRNVRFNNSPERVAQNSSLYYFDRQKPPSLARQLFSNSNKTQPEVYDVSRLQEIEEQNKILRVQLENLHESSKNAAQAFEREKQALIDAQKSNSAQRESLIQRENQFWEQKLAAAENEINQQKITISAISEKNMIYEDRLISTTKKLEKSVRTNQHLVDRSRELDNALNETHQKWLQTKKEYDSMERWTRHHKDVLADYENAVRESDLYDSYPDMLKDNLSARYRSLETETKQLRLEYTTATQKYLNESERLKALYASSQEQIRALEEQIADLNKQCSNFQRENLKLSLHCTKAEEDLKILEARYEEEKTELSMRSSSQIKNMREMFDADRCEFRTTIDKLNKQKIDLQAEVGQLLRDRRSAITEYRDTRFNLYSGA